MFRSIHVTINSGVLNISVHLHDKKFLKVGSIDTIHVPGAEWNEVYIRPKTDTFDQRHSVILSVQNVRSAVTWQLP